MCVYKELYVLNLEEEKIIPFTNYRYRLNKFGEVTDFNGEILKIENIGGSAYVAFDWVYGFQSYELGLVAVVTALNVKIPPNLFNRIEVIYSDNNQLNTMPSNLSYRFKGSPIELVNKPGFFYIPFYTSYGISEKGEVFSIKTNIILTWNRTKPQKIKNITGGYFVSAADKDTGVRTSVSRHRLLGLTFLKYEINPNKLVINHKNGIPGDDDPSNLEWVTRKENNIHAINSGLMPNSVVRLLVKNLLTGEIQKYNSIADCARALNIGDSALRVRVYKTFAKRYPDNLAFKIDDDREWPAMDKNISSSNGWKSVVAKNVFTGECFIFGSPTEAGDNVGVCNESVQWIANTESKRPINGFIFRYLTDDVVWPEYSFKELEMFRRSPKVAASGVLVKNPQGEEVAFYGNINTAAKECGVSPAEIRRYCNGKKTKNGNTFSFYKLDY